LITAFGPEYVPAAVHEVPFDWHTLADATDADTTDIPTSVNSIAATMKILFIA
jgi:hypothetical protein